MEFPIVLIAWQTTKSGDFKVKEEIVKNQMEADNFSTRYTKSGVVIKTRALTKEEKVQLFGVSPSTKNTTYNTPHKQPNKTIRKVGIGYLKDVTNKQWQIIIAILAIIVTIVIAIL